MGYVIENDNFWQVALVDVEFAVFYFDTAADPANPSQFWNNNFQAELSALRLWHGRRAHRVNLGHDIGAQGDDARERLMPLEQAEPRGRPWVRVAPPFALSGRSGRRSQSPYTRCRTGRSRADHRSHGGRRGVPSPLAAPRACRRAPRVAPLACTGHTSARTRVGERQSRGSVESNPPRIEPEPDVGWIARARAIGGGLVGRPMCRRIAATASWSCTSDTMRRFPPHKRAWEVEWKACPSSTVWIGSARRSAS